MEVFDYYSRQRVYKAKPEKVTYQITSIDSHQNKFLTTTLNAAVEIHNVTGGEVNKVELSENQMYSYMLECEKRCGVFDAKFVEGGN